MSGHGIWREWFCQSISAKSSLVKVGFDHAMTVGKHDSVHSPEQKTVEY